MHQRTITGSDARTTSTCPAIVGEILLSSFCGGLGSAAQQHQVMIQQLWCAYAGCCAVVDRRHVTCSICKWCTTGSDTVLCLYTTYHLHYITILPRPHISIKLQHYLDNTVHHLMQYDQYLTSPQAIAVIHHNCIWLHCSCSATISRYITTVLYHPPGTQVSVSQLLDTFDSC